MKRKVINIDVGSLSRREPESVLRHITNCKSVVTIDRICTIGITMVGIVYMFNVMIQLF